MRVYVCECVCVCVCESVIACVCYSEHVCVSLFDGNKTERFQLVRQK